MIYLKVGDLVKYTFGDSDETHGYVSKVSSDYYFVYYLKSGTTLKYVRRDAHNYICLINS